MIKTRNLNRLCLGVICILCLCTSAPLHSEDGKIKRSQNALPFVTVRDRTGDDDPKEYFGDERSSEVSGWCDVQQTTVPALSTLIEKAPIRIPGEFLKVVAIREADRSEIYAAFEAASTKRAPVLYTHGYNVGFEKGCRRATALQENANLKDKFFWFSWPADGVLTNYMRDETDLFWSAPSLTDLIAEMSERFAPQSVSIVGHSLGGRGIVLAMYIMAAQHPSVTLDNAVLLAPDMDFETFARILPSIRDKAARITVYTAIDDRALDVSEKLHGYPRLGQSGNPVEILEGVEVIDISELRDDSASGHLYHVYGTRVGQDLDRLINKGLGAAERDGLVRIGHNHWSLVGED
ncbi:MAG: alpha/beta hydrolase [Rhodobacteraceae bacterium]|nr:alpha/beta hydrolase [Paracoccaceae bacterium]